MMMLFVLNGDNDDRDENGEEEEACYGAETRRAALHRAAGRMLKSIATTDE